MPITIKTGYLNVRDEQGNYIRNNTVAEQTTAEQVADIEAAGAEEILAIENKGIETRASIPSDYTTLSDDVSELQSAVGELDNTLEFINNNTFSSNWESGRYNAQTGEAQANSSYIRNKGLIPDAINNVYVASGSQLKLILQGFDGDTFKGEYKNGAFALVAGGWLDSIDFKTMRASFPGYTFRIYGRYTDGSEITTAEAANVIFANAITKLNDHKADYNNPHQVTKAQLGLGNVDNTSDMNKPVSTAQQQAIDAEEARAKAREDEIEGLIGEGLEEAVADYVEEHPEAISTVQDGSITFAKLNTKVLTIAQAYVTPEMYDAYGDGEHDDSLAVQQAVNSGKEVLLVNKYRITQTILLKAQRPDGYRITGTESSRIILDSQTANVSVFSIQKARDGNSTEGRHIFTNVNAYALNGSNQHFLVYLSDPANLNKYYHNFEMYGCFIECTGHAVYLVNDHFNTFSRIVDCRINQCGGLIYVGATANNESAYTGLLIENVTASAGTGTVINEPFIYLERCNGTIINNVQIDGAYARAYALSNSCVSSYGKYLTMVGCDYSKVSGLYNGGVTLTGENTCFDISILSKVDGAICHVHLSNIQNASVEIHAGGAQNTTGKTLLYVEDTGFSAGEDNEFFDVDSGSALEISNCLFIKNYSPIVDGDMPSNIYVHNSYYRASGTLTRLPDSGAITLPEWNGGSY